MTRRTRAPVSLPPCTLAEAAVDADTRLRYRLIRDHWKKALALRRVAPGLVLVEAPVARIFGTSRVPVRKAFEMLHAGGLLHPFEGRDYLVAHPDGSVAEPLRAPLSEATLGLDEATVSLSLPLNREHIYQPL